MSSRPSRPVIRLQDVSKSFGNGAVVEDVSFSVEKGVCYGLLGSNGAGKSTTLKMIYGFLRPSSGSIHVDGIDVLRHPGKARQRLGIAPQEDLLDPDLTVTENLLFHARYSRIPREEARGRTARLKGMMGLEEHSDAAVSHLSTGLRRRLVLARSLLTEPSIVILDEPTRGLDREGRRQYIEALQRMKNRGVTLVLATHEIREAEALCDRLSLMDRGRLKATGSTWEILSRGEAGAVASLPGKERACRAQ